MKRRYAWKVIRGAAGGRQVSAKVGEGVVVGGVVGEERGLRKEYWFNRRTHADEELVAAGYGLVVFRSKCSALKFMKGSCGVLHELYRCRVWGAFEPRKLGSLLVPGGCGKRLWKFLMHGEDAERRGCSWPEGTLMCEALRLIRGAGEVASGVEGGCEG